MWKPWRWLGNDDTHDEEIRSIYLTEAQAFMTDDGLLGPFWLAMFDLSGQWQWNRARPIQKPGECGGSGLPGEALESHNLEWQLSWRFAPKLTSNVFGELPCIDVPVVARGRTVQCAL